jgi:hypothetical protein
MAAKRQAGKAGRGKLGTCGIAAVQSARPQTEVDFAPAFCYFAARLEGPDFSPFRFPNINSCPARRPIRLGRHP